MSSFGTGLIRDVSFLKVQDSFNVPFLAVNLRKVGIFTKLLPPQLNVNANPLPGWVSVT